MINALATTAMPARPPVRRGLPLVLILASGRKIVTWECYNCPRYDRCPYLDGRVDFQRAVERFQGDDGTVVYACRHFMLELAAKLEQRGGRR